MLQIEAISVILMKVRKTLVVRIQDYFSAVMAINLKIHQHHTNNRIKVIQYHAAP